MAIVKYKVIASYTDRFYFTRIVEVNSEHYPSTNNQISYVDDFIQEDFGQNNFDEWDEDGGEIIDFFTIESIEKI